MTLAYGRGLLNLTKEIADTDEFFTRLLPTGSTKNIVASKYGHTTLQLPDGKKWIDRNVDLYGIKEKWEEDAFADIFPGFTGTVGTVRTEVQTIDGSEITVYYFKAPDIPFNPNSYSIANTNKHEYTTNAALKAAVTLGDIVPLMSFGIKKLICYKSTSYTTYEDVIANRASADIDLQFDENGNPYNAGTSGTLIYSE